MKAKLFEVRFSVFARRYFELSNQAAIDEAKNERSRQYKLMIVEFGDQIE